MGLLFILGVYVMPPVVVLMILFGIVKVASKYLSTGVSLQEKHGMSRRILIVVGVIAAYLSVFGIIALIRGW